MPTRINSRRKKATPEEPKHFRVEPPWLGYCPDLNASLTSFSAFEYSRGLVNQNGQLTLDLGWLRLEGDPATLPLGGYADIFGDYSWTAADEGYEQPVVMLAELSREDTNIDKLSVFAVTGLSLVTIPIVPPADGTATIGFCWWLDPGTLDWTEVPWNGAAGGVPHEALRTEMFDWAFYPRGGTIISHNTRPGSLYFTNYEDEVYVWDPGSVAIGLGPPGDYQSAFGLPWGNESFYAKSVDTFVDRLVFLNTREENTALPGNPLVRCPKRARWTDLSSPPSLAAAGSGFLDFDEFLGAGLRVLAFQDLEACYFEDGVGLLRRTNTANIPFRKDYLSKERGLLGTFAVVRVARDMHFGVFTDGWFFLTSGGQWTEAGTVSTEYGLARKWTETFFKLLDSPRKGEIVVDHDEYTGRIRVTFPLASGGYTTWVYDMRTDSVWPDDPYTVVCWGEAAAVWGESVQWLPDMAGIPWSEVEGAWVDFGASYGDRATLHGTEDGLVLLHTPTMTTRDGVEVSWLVRSHLQYLETMAVDRVAEEFVLEHGITQIDRSVEVGFRNNRAESATEVIQMNTGGTGTRTASVAHPELDGYGIATQVGGTGAVRLWNWQVGFRPGEAPLKEVG